MTRACLIAFAVLASGCAGQQMTTRSTQSGEIAQGSDVAMVAITPELVAGDRPIQRIPTELASYRPETYRISPGDTILVTVWDHPELTTPAGTQQQALTNGRLVQPDGTFFYPYAGKINVSGMSIEELRSTLSSRLAQYIRDPKVDINVVGYGSRIALQGAFVDTSPQDITTVPLTLSQAIVKARINT